MVERGEITSNKIELTDGLIATFKRLWMQYVGDSDTFKSNIALPFWHMQSEPFWRLVAFDGREVAKNTFNGNKYSILNIRGQVKYANIDSQLFLAMRNSDNCIQLITMLRQMYLS